MWFNRLPGPEAFFGSGCSLKEPFRDMLREVIDEVEREVLWSRKSTTVDSIAKGYGSVVLMAVADASQRYRYISTVIYQLNNDRMRNLSS